MTTVETKFTGFPCPWVRNGELRNINAQTPHSLSALKLYMAILSWVDRADWAQRREQPSEVFMLCSPTYSDLQTTTGLDRSEIAPALQQLESWGRLRVLKQGKRNVYEILGNPTEGWAKVPLAAFEENKLRELGLKHTSTPAHMRKQVMLDAFKLYYLFLAFREKQTNRARISYDKIESYAGIRRRGIRRAISLLVVNGLIHAESAYKTTSDGTYRPDCNTYFIDGLAEFRPKKGLVVDPQVDGFGRAS